MKNPSTKLKHIAIICDGNRRWAQEHGMEVFFGHQKAVDEVIEPLIDRAAEHGVEFITFWVFSTENWQRPKPEVEYLMMLFRKVFESQVKRLHEKNIRVLTIGDSSKFEKDIQEKIKKGKELTENNTGITVVFALNYGGRDELLRAVTGLVKQKLKQELNEQADTKASSDIAHEGHIKTKTSAVSATPKTVQFSEIEFSQYLDTNQIPDPDFIIRPGGEQRLSGFLLWQSEYAELAFPKFYFPEFTPEKLDELVAEYGQRKRRFGK